MDALETSTWLQRSTTATTNTILRRPISRLQQTYRPLLVILNKINYLVELTNAKHQRRIPLHIIPP